MIGFPLGSKVLGLGSDGLPLYSNPYKSEQLREVNKQFFSQGVFGQEAMRVAMRPKPGNTFVSTDSIYVVVTDGCANVDGAFGIVKETGDIGMLTTTAASSSHTYVERHHVIGVRLNKGTGDETIEIFTDSSGDLYSSSSWSPSVSRDDSTYEIVLATVTSKSTYSNGNVSYNWILDDYRLDNYYCGLATGLITLDTTQFQQEMNDEIASYRSVIAAIQENADESMQELNEAIHAAVELAQDAIDGTVAGNIYNRLDALEADGILDKISLESIVINTDDYVEHPTNATYVEFTVPIPVKPGYKAIAVVGYANYSIAYFLHMCYVNVSTNEIGIGFTVKTGKFGTDRVQTRLILLYVKV